MSDTVKIKVEVEVPRGEYCANDDLCKHIYTDKNLWCGVFNKELEVESDGTIKKHAACVAADVKD